MKKLINFYNQLEAHLLVCSLIFTVILVFFQVILRYVFSSSLSWSEELARYIFIWQIWLGTSVAQRDNSHVRIEALGGSEESRRKTMLRIAADVIWLDFCLLLVKYGFELVASIYTRGLISAAMRMPMYLVYLSLPVSQLAVSLRIIGELWRTVKEYRNGAAEPVEGGGEA